MKFQVTIFQDEDGVYVVECPVIPGCISQGETEEEVTANIREAIKECLEVRRDKGLPPLSTSGTLRSLINRAGITVDEFLQALK